MPRKYTYVVWLLDDVTWNETESETFTSREAVRDHIRNYAWAMLEDDLGFTVEVEVVPVEVAP